MDEDTFDKGEAMERLVIRLYRKMKDTMDGKELIDEIVRVTGPPDFIVERIIEERRDMGL